MTAASLLLPTSPRRLWRRAVVLLGAALVVAGVLAATVGHPSTTGDGAALLTAPRDAAVSSTGTRAQALARAQAHLRAVPKDASAWAALGSLEVEQARVTADPTWYPKAAGAFSRSLALQPVGNADALVGQAMLANARHDFAGALRLGERARALRPYNAAVYGVVGDAEVELGRYDAAAATIQRMVDLRPDLASYSRVSYLRELHGDVEGATAALESAAQVAGNPSDAAFAAFQLGELRWNAGDVAGAAAAYERAVKLDPTYVPPVAALARVHAATGDKAAAAREYEAAIGRVPAPQYVTELGDLYQVMGQPAMAHAQAQLLAVEEKLFRANGVNVDLESSLFSADHHTNLAGGFRAARDEYARRKSVFVADALAWQLHANGRDAEALRHADEALRLGTRSALLHFHRGMIELSLGRADGARADLAEALAINPHFSLLHAPEASAAALAR